MNVIRTMLLALMIGATAASADVETRLRDAGSLGAIRLAGSEDAAASKVYIVQLTAPPAAAVYSPRALRMAGSAPAAIGERPRFNKTSAAVQGYAARLTEEQDRILAQAGAGAQLVHRYQYSLNGFAARMHPSLAHKLDGMPGVLRVWEDEIRPLATTHSLDFLELFDADKGLRGPEGLTGEDVIIAFIDSGIAPEHPALSDTREADRPRLCQTSWAENTLLGKWLCRRYDKLEDELLFEPVEDWNGICQGGEEFEDTLCNNKLIGARYFVAGANNSGPIDDGEIQSARDVDGHGTHTATIAAGNRVKASIFDTFVGRVEGVAPRARVAVYKACWLRPGDQRASCNTSDLANAIDAAVADGVDIINYSVGSSMREITAPDDLALMAATKAGVFSVVAAGNEGPNLGTIGSPAGAPWVMTAAASTRAGQASFEAIEVLSPPVVAGKYAMKEANFTPTLADRGPVEGRLVLVDDGEETLEDGAPGTTSDACEAIVNSDEISNNIALIQRGGCSFDTKLANADDAGATAAIVYNIAGPPIVMNGSSDLSDIPAVMIGQADGNLLLAELDERGTRRGQPDRRAHERRHSPHRERRRQRHGNLLSARPRPGPRHPQTRCHCAGRQYRRRIHARRRERHAGRILRLPVGHIDVHAACRRRRRPLAAGQPGMGAGGRQVGADDDRAPGPDTTRRGACRDTVRLRCRSYRAERRPEPRADLSCQQ
jgi:subtilisin family serine protease